MKLLTLLRITDTLMVFIAFYIAQIQQANCQDYAKVMDCIDRRAYFVRKYELASRIVSVILKQFTSLILNLPPSIEGQLSPTFK